MEKELCRKCHGLARKIFGSHSLFGFRAYEYYIKWYALTVFGKTSRKQLSKEEWEDIYAWLRRMLLIRRLFAPRSAPIRKNTP